MSTTEPITPPPAASAADDVADVLTLAVLVTLVVAMALLHRPPRLAT